MQTFKNKKLIHKKYFVLWELKRLQLTYYDGLSEITSIKTLITISLYVTITVHFAISNI